MRVKIVRDGRGDGFVPRAGDGGIGFLLEPAGDAPGSFPVTVLLDGHEPVEVYAARPVYPGRKFDFIALRGMRLRSTFALYVFEHREEEVGAPIAQSKRRSTLVAAGTELPTAAPTSPEPATDPDLQQGYPLHPGCHSIECFFKGTARDVDLWILTAAGNWELAEEDFAAAASMPYSVGRPVGTGCTRFYLQASGAGCVVEIDQELRT